MSEPIFTFPENNDKHTLIPKDKIDKIVVNSDSNLKRFYLIVEYDEYDTFAKLKPSTTSMEFFDNIPQGLVNKLESRQCELGDDGNAIYTIPFNGKKLVNGKHYLIHVYNYDSDYRKKCTIKVLHVYADGKVLVETPERTLKTTLALISIDPPMRRGGNAAYIDCSGDTTSPLSTAILTEQSDDDFPLVYSPTSVVLGPPTWSCSFRVGSHGVGTRTFTLYVANTQFDSAQITAML